MLHLKARHDIWLSLDLLTENSKCRFDLLQDLLMFSVCEPE